MARGGAEAVLFNMGVARDKAIERMRQTGQNARSEARNANALEIQGQRSDTAVELQSMSDIARAKDVAARRDDNRLAREGTESFRNQQLAQSASATEHSQSLAERGAQRQDIVAGQSLLESQHRMLNGTGAGEQTLNQRQGAERANANAHRADMKTARNALAGLIDPGSSFDEHNNYQPGKNALELQGLMDRIEQWMVQDDLTPTQAVRAAMLIRSGTRPEKSASIKVRKVVERELRNPPPGQAPAEQPAAPVSETIQNRPQSTVGTQGKGFGGSNVGGSSAGGSDNAGGFNPPPRPRGHPKAQWIPNIGQWVGPDPETGKIGIID